MSDVRWDCEKCGYNHYELATKCRHCATESNLPDMVNHPPHYKDESGIEGLLEAAKKLREFQSKDTDEYKSMEDYSYDLWGAIGDVVYELNKHETKIRSE